VPSACASAVTLPSAARADRATQRSRRFIFFMSTILPVGCYLCRCHLSLLLRVSSNGDDDVLHRAISNVSHLVQGSESHIEHTARPNFLFFAVMQKQQRPFLHHDKLRVLNFMRRIGHASSGLHGFVQSDRLSRRKHPMHNVPALPAIRHLRYRHLVKGKRPGVRERIAPRSLSSGCPCANNSKKNPPNQSSRI